MTVRRPIVRIDGRYCELPNGDAVYGAGVPIVIAAGDDFTVPGNVQLPYMLDIVVDGTITIDGVLQKVS